MEQSADFSLFEKELARLEHPPEQAVLRSLAGRISEVASEILNETSLCGVFRPDGDVDGVELASVQTFLVHQVGSDIRDGSSKQYAVVTLFGGNRKPGGETYGLWWQDKSESPDGVRYELRGDIAATDETARWLLSCLSPKAMSTEMHRAAYCLIVRRIV